MGTKKGNEIKENNRLAILLFLVASFTAGFILNSLFQVLFGELDLRAEPKWPWGPFIVIAPFLIYDMVKVDNKLLRISIFLFLVFFFPISTVFPFMKISHAYISDLVVMFALIYCLHLYFKNNIY